MEFTLPTETIELPSKGLLYPEGHPLSSGTIEMKYMTAKEEDILSNQSYITKGTVLDKLLQSLIVTEFNYNDLLIGDKNGLMVAARILGYGKDYKFKYQGTDYTVDLSLLEAKPIAEVVSQATTNEFDFKLPTSGVDVTFKLLTSQDESAINSELEGLKKLSPNSSPPELSTRLKHFITSINGERDKKSIRQFVDNYLLAADSRALRKYLVEITPDVDLTFFPEQSGDKTTIPIGLKFFWPDF
jgi:hypothetical protein